MARTNTYTCAVCGTTYEFCLRCQVAKPDYDAERFCNKNHSEIYAILSKHGCNLITADEALAALSAYNLDEITLTEDVLAHVERIKSEATVKVAVSEKIIETEPITVEEAPITEEKPIVKSNKKNKKKW